MTRDEKITKVAVLIAEWDSFDSDDDESRQLYGGISEKIVDAIEVDDDDF